MDSSTNALIINKSQIHVNKLNARNTSVDKWSTIVRSFLLSCKAKVEIKDHEPNAMAHISAQFHVTD